MSTSEYSIFPSEALLLGECLGEYRCSQHTHFIELIQRRLLPLIPSFRETKFVPGVGVVKDHSRTSLMDLLFDELHDSLALSPTDKQIGISHPHNRHVLENLAHNMRRLYDQYDPGDDVGKSNKQWAKEAFVPVGLDDRDKIAKVLTSIARSNGYVAVFELGMAFGRCVAGSESALSRVASILAHPEEEVEEFSVGTSLRAEDAVAVRHATELGALRLARQLMDHVELLRKSTLSITYEDWHYEATRFATDAHSLIWLAFGEVLGAIRENDELARLADEQSPTPRMFKISRSSTRDDVRLALVDAEQQLNSAENEEGRPEAIIRSLAPSIEALCRRVWAEDFSRPDYRDFSQLLGDRIRQGSELQGNRVSAERFNCCMS